MTTYPLDSDGTITVAECAALCDSLRWGTTSIRSSCGAFVWTDSDAGGGSSINKCEVYNTCPSTIVSSDEDQVFIKCVSRR